MIWFLTGLALIGHIYFWGAGLTCLLLPRRWLRFAWIFSGMAGLGLQSLVVLAAAHTPLPGAKSYAPYSLLLPVGLCAAAAMRLGAGRARALLLAARKLWALWLMMAFCLALQTYPFARLSPELTSMSQGSCDAADYAGGARTFQDFSGADRSGYLGISRVAEVQGIDNFQVYWLRLNHFTPSALIALNGAIFKLRPHKLASLLGAVLAVLALPVVFWLARSAFRMRPIPSGAVTLLYGCSPVVSYAVYHCALGQLMAAPAVALLTWTGVQAFRGALNFRRFAAYAGLLLLCHWLILGAYSFFIVFCYAPLLAYVGWETLRSRRWARAARWALFTGGTLALSALLFFDRVVCLLDRFRLLSQTEAGWRIAAFRPTGWYGLFADGRLEPASSIAANVLSGACLLALAYAFVTLIAQRRFQRTGLALACTIPALAGYGILVWQGQREGENASYDAYKIFSVFLPGLLVSFCLWFDLRMRRAAAGRMQFAAVAILAGSVLAANLMMTPKFAESLQRSGLIVDRKMIRLSTIEQMPDVKSVNVGFEVYWSRLWANYFLLRKPHYFRLPAYEGRPLGAPLGDWDLRENFLVAAPLESGGMKEINGAYYLIDRRNETFLDIRLGNGWPGGADFHRWGPGAWSGGSPQIEITNPHPYPLKTMVGFSVLSLAPRALQVLAGPRVVWEGKLGTTLQTVEEFAVDIAPGETVLEFHTPDPAVSPGGGDPRFITIALHRLNLRVAEADKVASPPLNETERQ